MEKKAKLNFYIWTNKKHYSLVSNIETYYIFFDSCSSFFTQWPSELIISSNKNDKLFPGHKIIVMKSFLQNDIYSCGSYAFAFLEILCNLPCLTLY